MRVRGDCSQWPATGRLPRAVSCVGGAAPLPQPTGCGGDYFFRASEGARQPRQLSNSARTCLHALTLTDARVRVAAACPAFCAVRIAAAAVAPRRAAALGLSRASHGPARCPCAGLSPSRRRAALLVDRPAGVAARCDRVQQAPQVAPRRRRASSGGPSMACSHASLGARLWRRRGRTRACSHHGACAEKVANCRYV